MKNGFVKDLVDAIGEWVNLKVGNLNITVQGIGERVTALENAPSAPGRDPSESENIEDLMNEVFPLTVGYASCNSGTFEVGTPVTPQATCTATRKGENVAASATLFTTPSTTINGLSYTGEAASEGYVAIDANITQGGQTKSVGRRSWNWTFYRYRGEVSSIPSDYASVIKSLRTRELSVTPTLSSTQLAANKHYLFAVRGEYNMVCRHATTDGIISGCVTGTCEVGRWNDDSIKETYTYILVPASSSTWNFKITQS